MFRACILWKEAAKRYREQLAKRGVTGFKDRSGKMWNMRTYTEMVERTTTMEAHLQGTANRLAEQGHDLVKVSTHLGACELCQPWQGQILSITGKTEGYPTLEEAKAAGLFHPNCRHAYGLYVDWGRWDKEIEELEREERELELLPGYENAIIPPDKLLKYSLNKEHKGGGKDKAIAFERALGYNINNYEQLMENVLINIRKYPAVYKDTTRYGKRYEVIMELTGPNGKSAIVKTGWLI